MEHQKTAYKNKYTRPSMECITVETEGHMAWDSTDDALGKRYILIEDDDEDAPIAPSQSFWGEGRESRLTHSQSLWED